MIESERPLRLYIAWTDRDICFQDHDSACHVLMSPVHVKQNWTVRRWATLPAALMVDSGSYQYMTKGRYPTPAEALARQMRLLDGMAFARPVGLCHLDIPVMFGSQSIERMRLNIRTNLANARQFLELLTKSPPTQPIEPIGVIQGYDGDTVYDSGIALADMGYQRFAIGSMIPLLRRHKYDEVRHLVAAAYEAVGERLHVLGVTSPELFDDFKRLGVESLDSSTPIREAVQGGVHYSRPYRRFRVPGVTPAAHDMLRSKRPGTTLERPLECPCPVCRVDPYQLFQIGSKAAANHRSLHNYFHLKWEVEGYPEA